MFVYVGQVGNVGYNGLTRPRMIESHTDLPSSHPTTPPPQEGEARIQGLVLPYYTSIVASGIRAIRGDGKADGSVPLDGAKLLQWRQSLGVSDVQARFRVVGLEGVGWGGVNDWIDLRRYTRTHTDNRPPPT